MNVGLNGFVVKQNDQNIARANSTVIGWQICKTAVRIGSIYVTRQWIFLLAVWMIVLLIWWTWLYIFASFSWDTLCQNYVIVHKVEKILKSSLDSIPSPSPSVKIQIMGKKFAWGVKAKHCWVLSTNFWNKKFVDITQQCFFPYYLN